MSASSLDIYCVAIGGTGMAPLACLLKQLGHRVRGADGPLYPPMSTLLEEAGIEPLVGWDPAHLEPPPDLVIMGNAVPQHNPEAEAVERRGLPRISMPEAVARFCLTDRRPLVAAGTHGKTTTTAMAAWVWEQAGTEPGYLVGGLPTDLGRSFSLGRGDRFIIEGDEYNAAYFDRGPKFLHYRPETLLLTSVEHDHADLYPEPEALREAFSGLIDLLPPDGLLLACGDSAAVRALAAPASCRVLLYGLGGDNDVRPEGPVEEAPAGCRARLRGPGWFADLALEVPGRHNLANALAVWGAACADGLDPQGVATALSRFRGVTRRLQQLGTVAGVTVVDDFAHHPTAVASSLQGLRQRHPGRRLVAVFEPRSLTAGRAFFFAGYLQAFSGADLALLAPLHHRDRLAPAERLDREALSRRLTEEGVESVAASSLEELETICLDRARPGDVVVCMSSGSFGGLPARLLRGLAARRVQRGVG